MFTKIGHLNGRAEKNRVLNVHVLEVSMTWFSSVHMCSLLSFIILKVFACIIGHFYLVASHQTLNRRTANFLQNVDISFIVYGFIP